MSFVIDKDNCIACGQCQESCRVEAIETEKTYGYAQFSINQDLCMECGACKRNCLNEAIKETK